MGKKKSDNMLNFVRNWLWRIFLYSAFVILITTCYDASMGRSYTIVIGGLALAVIFFLLENVALLLKHLVSD